MPITKLTPDYAFTEDRLEALKKVVPEAFADGKINWDVLQEALGEDLEDEKEEHFGLSWPGKREARRLAARPSRGTLAPCPGEGVNEETTENIFIEGENLEVMKILRKSYAGKIKMIYIDPPYNTGNDFIYNDTFSEPLEAYLKESGAISIDGELLTTNTRADGRFHSKWLSMIYPRLIVARELLKDDGIIFVSIDDTEIHNLLQVMNELFGEENYVSTLIRRSKIGGGSDNPQFAKEADYILCYSKQKTLLNKFFLPHSEKDLRRYNQSDSIGRYFWDTYARSGLASENPENDSLYYQVEFPDGTIIEERWRRSKERLEKDIEEGEAKLVKTKNGWSVHFKQRLNPKGKRPRQIVYKSKYGNPSGKKDLTSLFDGKEVFSYPKPKKLIKFLIQVSCWNDNNAIILDFFAGSGTTGEAVLELNIEESTNRQFILVQLPVETSQKEFHTISEITKERIRRAIKRIENKNQEYLKTISMEDQQKIGLGFSVFELMESNLFDWEDVTENNPQLVLNLFNNFTDPLKPDWEIDGLMTEILLVEGFPLTSEVHLLEDLQSNQVYQVSADGFCDHQLFVCLDKMIDDNTLNLLPLGENDIFICLDSALSDELKVRLEDKFNIHVI